jgi:hypothetical protein
VLKSGTNQESLKSSCENCNKNLNSTLLLENNQVDISVDLQEIIKNSKNEGRKELLDYLVGIQILKYSSFDEVYFIDKNGFIFFISEKIETDNN